MQKIVFCSCWKFIYVSAHTKWIKWFQVYYFIYHAVVVPTLTHITLHATHVAHADSSQANKTGYGYSWNVGEPEHVCMGVCVCRITSLTLLRFHFNEKKLWSRHLSLLFLFVCRLQMNMNMMDETQWTRKCHTRTRSSTFGTKISILRFENVQIHFFRVVQCTRHEMTEPEPLRTPIEMWYLFSIAFIRGKMIWWVFMRRRVCVTETKNNIKTEMNQISRCCEAYVYFTNLHALPPSLTLMTAIPGYRICNNKKGKSLFTVHTEQIQ